MSDGSPNNPAALEARIHRLEWSARFSLYVSLILLLAVGAGGYRLLMNPTNFVDRHGNFQLVNNRNEAKVYLYKGDSSSGVKLYDEMNEQRATLATSGEGSALTLRDFQTHMRIMARVSAVGPELVMADSMKNIRMVIQVRDDGARMLFYDVLGNVTYDTRDFLPPEAVPVGPGRTSWDD
jgi:hypothetical protein